MNKLFAFVWIYSLLATAGLLMFVSYSITPYKRVVIKDTRINRPVEITYNVFGGVISVD